MLELQKKILNGNNGSVNLQIRENIGIREKGGVSECA